MYSERINTPAHYLPPVAKWQEPQPKRISMSKEAAMKDQHVKARGRGSRTKAGTPSEAK